MQSTAPEAWASSRQPLLHVVVGILRDEQNRILISRRQGNVHLSGFWEFPGGKLESSEERFNGLARELHEELGVRVEAARPWLEVRHRFADRVVLLDVWQVDRFTDSARGCEGQDIAWVPVADLKRYRFPESNLPILRKLCLSERYAITADEDDPDALLNRVQACIRAGVRMIQFRAPRLQGDIWRETARQVLRICSGQGAMLILNAQPEMLKAVTAHGLHLSADRLPEFDRRHVPEGCWVGASCHDSEELRLALERRVDFVTLSPVRDTASHPGQPGMGWDWFSTLAGECDVPVYALGGLAPEDVDLVQRMGGWGVAGIRMMCGTVEPSHAPLTD